MLLLLTLIAAALARQPSPTLPTMTVDHDDTKITSSCLIEIAPGAVIEDANGNGVLQIDADNITVEFAPGSVLRGAAPDATPDRFGGIGIRIEGHRNVVLKNARVSGYKIGIHAEKVSAFMLEGATLTNNFRQRLRSTPKAEAGGDWLYPHHNDNGHWLKDYGASISIKEGERCVVRTCTVRQGQNGIVLDRVTGSRIYDNDCSFLSGWGLAMWRSNANAITRNALDFCVRGYSHGVYNRGQDSAGLLMFEQNSGNLIAENSITHGGDGIFGFAGREAIGEAEPPPGFDPARKGNNDNLIIANDLSYAPAHGLEMTFSYGNRVLQNRMVGNAICGIWGGYSQSTLIAENTFESNGEMAYGLERGGINIEHGSDNVIVGNQFRNNKCGVHLWWDNDGDLLKRPGIAATYKDVTGNIIAGNTFEGDDLVLQLRDDSLKANPPPARPKVRGTVYLDNKASNVKKELDVAPGIELVTSGTPPMYVVPKYEAYGETHPVGARKELEGRQNIIMTEWGPWDHEGPMIRPVETAGARHVYEFHNIDPKAVRATGRNIRSKASKAEAGKPWTLTIDSASMGVRPYTLEIDEPKQTVEGALLSIRWDLTVFPWKGEPGPKPPPDLDQWRAAAKSPDAKRAKADKLSFQFGGGGPSSVEISPEITAAKFRPDYFGIIATARVPLTKGKWRIKTTSDDGVRVIADGKTVIENWTHHGAAEDTAELDLKADKAVEITVEYFEIYGAAVLDFQLEPAP